MSPVTEGLRQTNRKLRALLDALAPPGSEPVPATPAQLADLFAEILQAGEWLRQRPVMPNDLRLNEEINQYRSNMERLQRVLPVLRAHLLAERAHLEEERRQIQATTAWVRTARKTT